jgi:hypothetical protein
MKLMPAHVAFLLFVPNMDGRYEVYAAHASMHVLKSAVKSDISGSFGASELQNIMYVTLLKTGQRLVSTSRYSSWTVDSHWVVYVWPVVVCPGFEQLFVRDAKPVGVADGTEPVTVTVLVAGFALIEALSAASFVSASFARFASTPVPAARPITAAANTPMVMERMKTRNVHPQIIPLDLFPGAAATDSGPRGPSVDAYIDCD